MNVGKKIPFRLHCPKTERPNLANLCTDLQSGGINSSDPHLPRSCSAFLWESFSRWASSSVFASARLPVCDLYPVPRVPRECPILLDRWLDYLQSPQGLPDGFCLQHPLPGSFLGLDYCLAFVSAGPSASTQKPKSAQPLVALWCFYFLCGIVQSIVFILGSERSMPCFYPR